MDKTNPGETRPGQPERPPASDALFRPHCYHCNEYGYIAAKCPRRITTMLGMSFYYYKPLYIPGTIEGKPVQRTGCMKTLVHDRWITPPTLTGEKIWVTVPDGYTKPLPLAKVTLTKRNKKLIMIVTVNGTSTVMHC